MNFKRWLAVVAAIMGVLVALLTFSIYATANANTGQVATPLVVDSPLHGAWEWVWRRVDGGASPPGDFNQIAALSSESIWVVGSKIGSLDKTDTPALIMHADGRNLRAIPDLEAEGGVHLLQGVSGVSVNDVWAVGSIVKSGGRQVTLTMRWNGSTWTRVTSPNSDYDQNSLSAVAGFSPDDVWAVGHYQDSTGATRALIQRWNGRSWSMVPVESPGEGDFALTGVTTISSNDV